MRFELVAGLAGDACRPGQLCVCCWTIDTEGTHALLVEHQRFGWMPAGGHVIAGEAILTAAARELEEETGITGCELLPVSLHATSIPAKADQPGHMHYAFGVLCIVDRSHPLAAEAGQAVRWWSLAEGLPDSFFGDNDFHRTLAERYLHR